MSLHGFRTVVVCSLFGACCVLALLSCSRYPSAPEGSLLVHVSENGNGPSPGKVIEIRGTSLSQTTDENGQAQFTLRRGNYVVRAYDIGTPGPSRLYVEQSVEIRPARTTEAQFNDCTLCRIQTGASSN
jgi:hypothetical protein